MAPKNSVAAYDKEIAALEHELWCSKRVKAGGQKPDAAKTKAIEAAIAAARTSRKAELDRLRGALEPETAAAKVDVETADA